MEILYVNQKEFTFSNECRGRNPDVNCDVHTQIERRRIAD